MDYTHTHTHTHHRQLCSLRGKVIESESERRFVFGMFFLLQFQLDTFDDVFIDIKDVCRFIDDNFSIMFDI